MISVPPNIQAQLGEAISIIADSDFFERWDTLVDVGYAPTSSFKKYANNFIGSSITSNSRQCESQQWDSRSRPFDIQALETVLQV